MEDRRSFLKLAATGAAAGAAALTLPAIASAKSLDGEAVDQLHSLVRDNRAARAIYHQSKGQLVFPKIVKGGLVVGASYGKGVLMEGGGIVSHYNSVMGSVGFQAGVQAYGYVVFLITDKAIRYIHDSDGWEIGVGPTVVVVDDGAAKNISTSTIKDDAYAFIFNQRGLMAGVSLEGTKITRIK